MTQDTTNNDAATASEQAAVSTPAIDANALNVTRSSINSKWSFKMILIALAMFGLGIWGLVDAMIVYPNRGAEAAEFSEYQRLNDLKQSGRLANDLASIKDPVKDLATLQQTAEDTTKLTPGERATLDWLTQLRNISKLSPDNTAYPRTDFRREDGANIAVGSADQRLGELTKKFVTPDGKEAKSPSPLSKHDIPTQWAIALAGFAVGLYMMWVWMKARSKAFQWDPATHMLTLPNGIALTPADIAEFDKSKWDKLFIHLHIKPEHKELGGKALELDLLRYVPVEAWVLEMERVAGLNK